VSIYVSLPDFLFAYKNSVVSVQRSFTGLLCIDYGTKKIGLASTKGLSHPIVPQAVIRPPNNISPGKYPELWMVCIMEYLNVFILLVDFTTYFRFVCSKIFPSIDVRERVYIDTVHEAIKLTESGWIVMGWPLNPIDPSLPYNHPGIVYSSPSIVPVTNNECQKVKNFITRLRASKIYLPIILWDERSSSKLARDRLRSSSPSFASSTLSHRSIHNPSSSSSSNVTTQMLTRKRPILYWKILFVPFMHQD
jgi:RNase H-fold protein (predicted Holliday junction resolvase)